MGNKIKQCPFCWSTIAPTLFETHDPDLSCHGFWVNCRTTHGGCGAIGPVSQKKEWAIKKWNTRHAIVSDSICEQCLMCGEASGRCKDNSLYWGKVGPLCENCYNMSDIRDVVDG